MALWAELESKLTSIDGDSVSNTVDESDEEHRKLIKDGKVFDCNVHVRFVMHSQCHWNCVRLWDYEDDGALKIATGYALMEEDGVWRQHSWIVANKDYELSSYTDNKHTEHPPKRIEEGDIVETTVYRTAYYGYLLTENEAEEFLYMNDRLDEP